MIWWADCVGVPFVDGGRDSSGWDCWGLVRVVFERELGIALPSHEGIGAMQARGIAQAVQASVAVGPWVRVDMPRAFDVMVARHSAHGRLPGHVGVMIDAGRVLHVWQGRETHVARVADPALAGLVLGFYRHRGAPCLN